MKKKRRKRAPTPKDGEVIVFWGYADGDGPDACVAWGDEAGKANARFLLDQIAPLHSEKMEFFKELANRGFDLDTFRMSVRKKASQE